MKRLILASLMLPLALAPAATAEPGKRESTSSAVVARTLAEAPFSERQAAVALVEKEMDRGRRILALIERGAVQLWTIERDKVNAAVARLREVQDRLDLAAARAKDAKAGDWPGARRALVSQYDLFQSALAEAVDVARQNDVDLAEAVSELRGTPPARRR